MTSRHLLESTFYAQFGAFTPLPNVFIDHAMPHLTDTEWRLLCVITRATLGWAASPHESDERKSRDWLSHSQLMARTGRSSEVVSRALQALVQSELVEVYNARGECLQTPAERRRNGGRLYYSLHRLAKDAARHVSKTFSPNRPGKIGTTKESENKKLSGDRVPSKTLESVPVLEMEAEFWGKKKQSNPDVRRFLRAYKRRVREWKLAKDQEASSRLNWGRDGKIAKELLLEYDYFRLMELLDQFLARQAKRAASFSLLAFQQSLRSKAKPRKKVSDRFASVRHGRWMRAGQVERSRK